MKNPTNLNNKVDALGGKPLPLTAALRFAESDLHGLKKRRDQGFETTIPMFADVDGGEIIEARPIDERINELEAMIAHTKAAIAWAEAKRPGSSKTEDGSLLLEEYEKETGQKA